MAETALFSSFRRPEPPRLTPVPDTAVELPARSDPLPSPQAVASGRVPHAQGASHHPEALAAEVPSAGTETEQRPIAPWADMTAITVGSDQLGLINPSVITLVANLPSSSAIALEAETAGLYRPLNFRPAPWNGLAYNQPKDLSTGLAAGTRILTARGEVEVEKLMPGDAAMGLRGTALVTITRIGRTGAAVSPIAIDQGALGPNTPRRTLCLGPDQTLFIKPEAVAARSLVNGSTIRRLEGETSELFHIDLGRAEVILAEGVALSSSESTGQHA